MTTCRLDFEDLLSDRSLAIDVSGIRRVFELGAKLDNPINLSIGQPDFPVPDALKDATIDAIRTDRNGYTTKYGSPMTTSSPGSSTARHASSNPPLVPEVTISPSSSDGTCHPTSSASRRVIASRNGPMPWVSV